MSQINLPQMEYDPLTEYIDINKEYLVTDEEFAKSSFLVDLGFLEDDEDDIINKSYYKTVADSEFMDTSLGGHIALGMPYAFTRFADIPKKGLLTGRDDYTKSKYSINLGMGRSYAERFQINSKSRILYLEFGKPKFRSMFSFYSSSVDYGKSIIANEGRTTFWYNLGQVVGRVATIIVYPGLTALYYLGKLLNKVMSLTDDRYYSFKPDMHNYIQTANSILTQFQVERGLIKFSLDPNKTINNSDRYGVPVTIDTSNLEEMAEIMPDIFDKDYGLNLYNVIARPQRIVNGLLKKETKMLKDGLSTTVNVENPKLKKLEDMLSEIGDMTSFKSNKGRDGRVMVENQELPKPDSEANQESGKNEDGTKKKTSSDSWDDEFHKYLDVVSNYGMEYIALYVDYTKESTITFSNEIGDIPAKSVINNIGSASRDVRFSLSGGNVLGGAVDEVIKAGRDIASGTLNSATFGLSNVIMGLIGGGYLTFPKMWKNSSVTLPSHQFKMRLGGPYGNPISLMLDIDVISSLLFAGIAPLNIGSSAYTSPYLCRAFMRGVLDIDFGMITEFSYTVASGAGRNIYGQPLEVDLTFTITDFSDVATAPVNDGLLGVFGGEMNDHDTLTKFIKSMGARSYVNSRYVIKGSKFKLARIEKELNDFTNPAKYATMIGDSVIGDILKISNANKSITTIFE